MLIEQQKWDDLTSYREALEHHGVKNMRWYHHIFGKEQKHAKYYRGSSNSSDKKKAVDVKAKAKAEKKAADAKAKAEKKAADDKVKAEKKAAKAEEKRREILKSPTKLYKNRDQFTVDEIKAAIDRFKWESELQNYSKKTMENGANFIKAMNDTLSNGIDLYNSAARIVNTLTTDKKDKPTMPFVMNMPNKDNKDKNKDSSKEFKKMLDEIDKKVSNIEKNAKNDKDKKK